MSDGYMQRQSIDGLEKLVAALNDFTSMNEPKIPGLGHWIDNAEMKVKGTLERVASEPMENDGITIVGAAKALLAFIHHSCNDKITITKTLSVAFFAVILCLPVFASSSRTYTPRPRTYTYRYRAPRISTPRIRAPRSYIRTPKLRMPTLCGDGSMSRSGNRSGACSYHGGKF